MRRYVGILAVITLFLAYWGLLSLLRSFIPSLGPQLVLFIVIALGIPLTCTVAFLVHHFYAADP